MCGTALLIILRRCSPASEEASKSVKPGVSIEPLFAEIAPATATMTLEGAEP
jgi:hypothetical protein